MFSLENKVIKKLPQQLTSYDFLKSFALITMVIDHIGYYFFPDQAEWRIIGRMSMPVWMFLIGYAQNRDIKFITLGAGVLLLSNVALGLSIFPLDILFTIIFIRLLIGWFAKFIAINVACLFGLLVILASLTLSTYHYFDYGTAAFMYAVLGYIVRRQVMLGFSNAIIMASTTMIFIVNVVFQQTIKSFEILEFIAMVVGMGGVSYLLLYFTPKIYSDLTSRIPNILIWVIKIMGRKTLLLYILQMLFFKIGRYMAVFL